MAGNSTDASQLRTILLGIAIILFSLHLTIFGVYEGDEAQVVLQSGILFAAVGLAVVFVSFRRP